MESGRLSAGLIVANEVPGGGDSAFDSLHILASNCSNLARPACAAALELREMLVDEILKRPEDYKIGIDRNQKKVLRLMRFQGQLPGVEIFYAFSHYLGAASWFTMGVIGV